MRTEPTIVQVITEMAAYWSLCRGHELKTRLQFEKLTERLQTNLLSKIKPEDLVSFYYYLRENSKGTDESVKRKFEYVRRVFKYAHARGHIKQNPCQLIKLPKSRRHSINSLSQIELRAIEQLQLQCERSRAVRDAFLFQCYTGMAFQTLVSFNRNMVITVQGRRYISAVRKKTGVEFFLPLTEKAVKLCEHYQYNFNVCDVNTFNQCLKIIQQSAGIGITLTSHVGRRTFGQHMIDSAVPLETVSKMLGHSSTTMTEKYYARAGMVRVINDVGKMAA